MEKYTKFGIKILGSCEQYLIYNILSEVIPCCSCLCSISFWVLDRIRFVVICFPFVMQEVLTQLLHEAGYTKESSLQLNDFFKVSSIHLKIDFLIACDLVKLIFFSVFEMLNVKYYIQD